MTTDINEPVEVPQPEAVTVLESAIAALNTCTAGSKMVHLTPRQALSLLVEDERKTAVIGDLADRLSAYEERDAPHYHESLARIWDNETDEVYDG